MLLQPPKGTLPFSVSTNMVNTRSSARGTTLPSPSPQVPVRTQTQGERLSATSTANTKPMTQISVRELEDMQARLAQAKQWASNEKVGCLAEIKKNMAQLASRLNNLETSRVASQSKRGATNREQEQ